MYGLRVVLLLLAHSLFRPPPFPKGPVDGDGSAAVLAVDSVEAGTGATPSTPDVSAFHVQHLTTAAEVEAAWGELTALEEQSSGTAQTTAVDERVELLLKLLVSADTVAAQYRIQAIKLLRAHSETVVGRAAVVAAGGLSELLRVLHDSDLNEETIVCTPHHASYALPLHNYRCCNQRLSSRSRMGCTRSAFF